MAAHGVVVLCPEHRDGSAALSIIRNPAAQDRFFSKNTRRAVPYIRMSHDPTPETWALRNSQLKVRCWELGLIHDALLNLDLGLAMRNFNTSTPTTCLAQLASKLNVHEPGAIIFSGHSFGAATMVQFLKSTYYAGSPELANVEEPLFVPGLDSRLRAQVTPKNLLVMLDMWCFPLLAPTNTALYQLPLPAYADNDPTAPGGDAILAIESETFFKWTEHLHSMCRVISPDPGARVVSAAAFQRPNSGVRLPEPNFFYVPNSAHLNQSDFGVLFPWLTKKVFGADHPERSLRLNVRAMLQLLRINGVPVARTWAGDLVDGADIASKQNLVESASSMEGDKDVDDGILDDKAIFDRSGSDPVDFWKVIDIIGMGAESGHEGKDGQPEGVEGESEMETEIEGLVADVPLSNLASAAA